MNPYTRTILLVITCCIFWQCTPEDTSNPSQINTPRILAVRTVPAEAEPGTEVTLDALVVDAQGRIQRDLDWAFCTTPKPPTENNIVAAECLQTGVLEISNTPTARTSIPSEACKLFGPEPPGPGLRARDPDITGGYYQPIRLRHENSTAFGLQRIRCNLAQAPLRVAQAFREEYTNNINPTLQDLSFPSRVHVNTTHTLQIASAPPESYVLFNPTTRDLQETQETQRVSWFTTLGTLQNPQTNLSTSNTAINTWNAPNTPGDAYIFVVLRDSRGGVDFREAIIQVTP